jgi:hypothetical protein
MAILSLMSDEESKGERGAAQDLAEGLDLMLRAARKAVRGIDPGRLEDLGRRARENLDRLDRKKVEEMGRKAAEKLDPRRIEEIAEDAGRELMRVVERVADRVETVVSGRKSSPPPAESPAEGDDKPPRVRVED